MGNIRRREEWGQGVGKAGRVPAEGKDGQRLFGDCARHHKGSQPDLFLIYHLFSIPDERFLHIFYRNCLPFLLEARSGVVARGNTNQTGTTAGQIQRPLNSGGQTGSNGGMAPMETVPGRVDDRGHRKGRDCGTVGKMMDTSHRC